MAIDGKYQKIEVANLRLDPNNPRLPAALRNFRDEKKVLEWMLTDATLIDLIASIVENGFFEGEPIIAMKEGDHYTVLEGNRRLAALKLLENPALTSRYAISLEKLAQEAKEKNKIPLQITVFVCNDRAEVENYLGFRHVSGIKPWPVISKARYLQQLFDKKLQEGHSVDHDLFRELAREIGSKAPYVRRLLYGYELYKEIENNKFYRIEGLEEESFDFTLITDAATKYSEIASYLGINYEKESPLSSLNSDRLREVTHWLYEKIPGTAKTRVGESRNLTLLNQVLRIEASRNAFIHDNKPLQEAVMLSDIADDNFREFLNKASYFLQQSFNIANQLRFPQTRDLKALENLRNTIEDLEFLLNRKIKSAERESRFSN